MRRIAFRLLAIVVAGFAVGCSKPDEQRITVACSNDMDGEIRSCGCAAHDYGGLGRRATYIEGLRGRSENFLLFEGGDFFGVDVNYGEQKARLTLQAMSFMGYNGIVVGEEDFALGVDYLVERVNALNLPVVAANLVDSQTGERLFPAWREFELASGLSIGVIGVLGGELVFPDTVPEGRLEIASPKQAIEDGLAELRDRVDLVVVLAHMPVARARRLAEALPDVDLVVTGHDARPQRKATRYGNAYLLTTSDRGRYVGVGWGTWVEGQGITDFQTDVEALTPEYGDHNAIVKLFQSYDVEIARKERARVSTALGKGRHSEHAFAGGDACVSCHESEYEQWTASKHAHAFDILTSRNREFDRDCTPCHTTGFYELGGFLSVTDTPELVHVQCEACHGNSAAHARNPDIKTPGNAQRVCRSCHTEDQTPGFAFENFWPKIAH